MNSIALISYAFPPYNSIASQRSVKLVNQFLDYYNFVYVFTLSVDDIPVGKRDDHYNTLYNRNDRVKIIQVPLARFGYEDPKKASLLQRAISGVFTRILWSNGIFWCLPLQSALNQLLHAEQVNMICVTGPPFLPFFLTSKIAVKFNIPYILDYRDLWTSNPRTPAFAITRRIIKRTFEQKALYRAHKILTVSDGCAKSLWDQIGDRTSVFVLKNLPDRKYREYFLENFTFTNENNGHIKMVITGSVYASCSLWPILEAIRLCDKQLIARLSIHYYGSSSAFLKKEFSKYKMSFLFIDHGHVSKEMSIRALGSADILISLVDDGKNGYNEAIAGVMTTKIFDYFLSGKPILNIGPVASDINNFASEIKYPHYFSFEASASIRIARFLESFLVEGALEKEGAYNTDQIPLFEESFKQLEYGLDVRSKVVK